MKPDIARAEAAAEAHVKACGLKKGDIFDLEANVYDMGLSIVTSPALTSAEAMFVRPTRQIVIGAHLSGPRLRFTLAHELGHFVLHESGPAFQVCTAADLACGHNRAMEAEANAFAASLLVPASAIEKRWWLSPGSLKHAAVLTNFGVSLSAAALRFVALWPTPVVAVISDGEKVIFSRASQTAPDLIRAGQAISELSLVPAARDSEFQNIGVLQRVPGRAWSPSFPKDVEEDSFWSKTYGFSLSLIFLTSQEEPNDAPWPTDDDIPPPRRK